MTLDFNLDEGILLDIIFDKLLENLTKDGDRWFSDDSFCVVLNDRNQHNLENLKIKLAKTLRNRKNND